MRNCAKCGKTAQILLHPKLGDGPNAREDVQLAVCLDPACGWRSEKHSPAGCEFCVDPTAQAAAVKSFNDQLAALKAELAAIRAAAVAPPATSEAPAAPSQEGA